MVRRWNPLFLEENLARAKPLLDALRDIASGHEVTAAQIALAWLVDQPSVVAIPGASSPAQVEQNAAAADLALSQGEVAGLTDLARAFRPVGLPTAAVGMVRANAAR